MTQAYLVTEGKSDLLVLKKLLPKELVKHTVMTAGSGRYAAQALASSILAVKQRPVALVVDADTEDENTIREREGFSRDLLRRSTAGVPFEVFSAVPEIEAVFFHDKSVFEQIVGQKLQDREWAIARHQPKRSLAVVLGDPPVDVKGILDGLTPEIIRVLQQHPLISGVSEFLSSVVHKVA